MTAGRVEGPFDVVIVGAGPAGLAAGAQAARRGLAHVVLERGEIAQTIVWYQKRKLVMAEPEDLPLHPGHPLGFAEGSREAVLEAWLEGTRAAGTNVQQGPANEIVGVEGTRGEFEVTLKDGRRLKCAAVVLAIGQSNLNKATAPGSDLPHVTYQLSDPDAHEDERIVVVGVGDAGIENALVLAPRNEVSIVNKGTDFPRAQPRNQELIRRAVAAGSITQYSNATVKRFEEGALVIGTDDGEVRLDATRVICRIGARPPGPFLRALGIQLPSDDPAALPELSATYESNVPGIYLVGAVAGYPLIKNCLNQGYEVIEHLLGNPVEPADEPKLRQILAGMPGATDEVLERIRTGIPLLGELNRVQLRKLLGQSRVHFKRSGDVVVRRNDHGSSLFMVLDGALHVSVPASDADVDTVYGRPAEREEPKFPLAAGEFFGEMSLISDALHSGTVVAQESCTLIEAPRQAMVALMHTFASVARELDRAFIARKLAALVEADARSETVRALACAAVIERFEPGGTLFAEGDPSDGLHLIRRGSVTVSQVQHGREVILAYVQVGNLVGEAALVSPDARRTATVRAAAYTETIRVPDEVIRALVARDANLRTRLARRAHEHAVANVTVREGGHGDLVRFLMDVGAGEATNILLIDESLCVRCNNCETACAETHGGVSRLDREAGPTFASIHVPTSCRHCENPKCMTDCPPDAIRRHPNGEVFIKDNCIGCGNCERNCPYQVIQMAPVEALPRRSLLLRLLLGTPTLRAERAAHAGKDAKKKAVKCDLCRDLPAGAACERSCPTGAVVRVDPKTYIDQIMRIR